MRTFLPPLLGLLTLLIVTGCGVTDTPEQQALAHSYVRNTRDAIAAVRHEITIRHGNPDAYEYRAGRKGTRWFVTAWHIVHPKAKGHARFDETKFTTYIVSNYGRVIESLPGR